MLADLGFFGNVGRKEQQMFPAYMVVAGAEIGEGKAQLARQIDRVSARDLPEFVYEVLKLWLLTKDSYSSFAAYVDGEGTQEIRAIADRFRTIPEFSVDKTYYYDWGAKDTFSLVGKGLGECSAGLFDLIEVDLKSARHLREELRSGDSQDEDTLYAIALRSARALLITRGFENFLKHFIQAGLIGMRFEPVIAAAQQKNHEALYQLEEEVFALLEAVEALYRSMDNSLRFAVEAKA
jgi:sulfite reductase (ferredoxin)